MSRGCFLSDFEFNQRFDQQKMAAALTEKAGREINAYNLPLQNCQLNISLDTLRFQLDGKFWAYSIKNNRLLDEGAIPLRGKERHWMEVDDEKEGRPVTSPMVSGPLLSKMTMYMFAKWLQVKKSS